MHWLSECLLLTIVDMDVLGLTVTLTNHQVLKQPNLKFKTMQGLGTKYPLLFQIKLWQIKIFLENFRTLFIEKTKVAF